MNVLLINISVKSDKDKQVLISSKKTQSSLFLYFSFFDSKFISFILSIICSSVIPGLILKVCTNSSPLFKIWLNFFIKEVFPQPVSPIIITGTFALIL